jgi:uncharacterized protein YecT (DUF1311 family)
LKLSKKYNNGQNEAVGGQYSNVEHALAANPKSGFSTVSLGCPLLEVVIMKPFLPVGLILLMITLSACSSLTVKSSPNQEVAQVSNCSSAKTQFDLDRCANQMAQIEYEKLTSLIIELQGHMDASQYADLLQVEANWEKVAKDHCAWEVTFFADGSIQPMSLADCLYQQFKQRIEALRLNLCEGNGITGECEASLKFK